jgi:hypothetical protein
LNRVQVEILGLSSSPSAGGAYALLLKESFGQRRLPIIIGSFEAQAIALEIEGIKPPRPLTHDLLKQVLDNVGATLNEVVIDELKDNTFFAKLIIEISSITNSIDSRPSDAIALAVRANASIYVTEDVMRAASFIPSGKESDEKFEESLEFEDDEEEFDNEEKPMPAPPTASPDETEIAQLQTQLREAIEKEDYERAVKIRDKINIIQGTNN